MSIEHFSKLSLEESMVTTRAGAAKARQNPDRDRPLPSIESTSPVSETPSLVISTNDISYDVSQYDSDLRRRVKRGLEDNEIRMKYCKVADDDSPNGTNYFYIDDDITVAMGGKLRRPRCTCGAKEKGTCKHIFWLYDHILSTAPEIFHEQPFHIQDLKPAEILDAKGLAVIASDRNWQLQVGDLPENDEQMRTESMLMLSVFEPHDALPGEFNPLTSERSKKFQEFAELLIQHATRDPGLFLQFREIMDPNFQSRVFFEKIELRVTRAFNALDDHIANVPMNTSPEALRLDVPNCAKQLTALVKAIEDFYQQRVEDSPDTRDVAVRAAAALITMLNRVTDRNENAYKNSNREAPTEPGENNLFVALIGNRGTPFVLDALESLPQEDVNRSWETLQAIEHKLAHADTPSEYMAAFRRVVYERRKRAASEVREGESKRAMQ